jgi:hypothetical protein
MVMTRSPALISPFRSSAWTVANVEELVRERDFAVNAIVRHQ